MRFSEKLRSNYYRNIAFAFGIPPGAFFMHYFILSEFIFDLALILRFIVATISYLIFRILIKRSYDIIKKEEERYGI